MISHLHLKKVLPLVFSFFTILMGNGWTSGLAGTYRREYEVDYAPGHRVEMDPLPVVVLGLQRAIDDEQVPVEDAGLFHRAAGAAHHVGGRGVLHEQVVEVEGLLGEVGRRRGKACADAPEQQR